ncbi:MAG: FAD-dependent oxidoreductase [FCB group bacterium]|nr:FAD-dependent oxidoreductase [FCB group bacterium]
MKPESRGIQTAESSDLLSAFFTDRKVSLKFGRDRENTYLIGPIQPSPCTWACPAGVNVKAYVSLIAAGRFQAALDVVRERNPLPGICGRICTHPCESYCNRNQIDDPVAIRELKRFVADYELAHPPVKNKPIPRSRNERVAIIGSGPAGLTAANDLVRKGYGVTVFEALPEPGGMLVAGIPAFRLPRDIIEAEIDFIRNLGVEIKTNTRISGKQALGKLLKKGFQAVLIAVGAHKGKKLNIPGEEEYTGIIDCVDFLNQVNFGNPPRVGEKVIVIGGGNSALDSARTALRLESKEVYIVYRRSRREMPADEAEIAEAVREGIKIHYLAAPKQILGRNGRVTGLECLKVKLGEPDASGRRRPVPIKGSEFIVEADTIISAISQKPDLSFLGSEELETTSRGTLQVDEETLATSRPGIFAAGDATTGPRTVIEAIAAGHVAAGAIDRYLNHEPLTEAAKPIKPELEIRVDLKKERKIPRAKAPMVPISHRQNNFREVELGFTEAAAVAEAKRCLRCGPCSECFICVPECPKEVTLMSLPGDREEALFRLPPEVRPEKHNHAPWKGVFTGQGKRYSFNLNPVLPFVKETLCRGCGDCVAVCDYSALQLFPTQNELSFARIDENRCRGCGTCVAVCSTSALTPRYFDQRWLTNKLSAIQPEKTNVVVFTCSWNGSQIDGPALSDMESKNTNVVLLRLMCSGQIEPAFVLRAFDQGADRVLITGCREDRCHYEFGAKQATGTFEKIRQLLFLMGMDSERIRFERLTDKDPVKFIELVKRFTEETGRNENRPKEKERVAL